MAALQTATPLKPSQSGDGAGMASDHSGQGAGNGTGTGGAQLAALLKRGREEVPAEKPTSKSIVEAQSGSDPATEFLARQARQQIEAKAADATRESDRAAARAAEAQARADKAAKPGYAMPNPLPTAPILQP